MSSLRGIKREEFSQKVKTAALKRCMRDGIPHCESCGVRAVSKLFFDHIQPDGLGGEPTLENCQAICRTCHDLKTITEDQPRMQKADRVAKKNHGLMPRRKSIQSAGFRKAAKPHTATRLLVRKCEMPE